MSETIHKSSDFIRLFLSTNPKQAKVLIKSATSEQLSGLCEIAFNLLTVVVPEKVKRKIKKYKTVFQKLAKKNLSDKSKIKLILKIFTGFLSIFLALKPIIFELIGS